MQSRRSFITTTAAMGGTVFLPFAARSAAHASDIFATPAGDITVHPVNHASFVMETPLGVIYVDPVGSASLYGELPGADLILITHEHGDHYQPETLNALLQDSTQMIVNPAVYGKLAAGLKARSNKIANGETTNFGALKVDAIAAYNSTASRQKYHPKGRDNSYVLSFEGFRVYISGDTEDVPEMRALSQIDLAFLCMNLPFTMDVTAAASAVAAFRPRFVYPYHYRGRQGGTQDPAQFADLVGAGADVRLADWYG